MEYLVFEAVDDAQLMENKSVFHMMT